MCIGKYDSQDGDTALICAAKRRFVDCVQLLIDAGADKDAKDNVRRQSLLLLGRLVVKFSSFSSQFLLYINILCQRLPIYLALHFHYPSAS